MVYFWSLSDVVKDIYFSFPHLFLFIDFNEITACFFFNLGMLNFAGVIEGNIIRVKMYLMNDILCKTTWFVVEFLVENCTDLYFEVDLI